MNGYVHHSGNNVKFYYFEYSVRISSLLIAGMQRKLFLLTNRMIYLKRAPVVNRSNAKGHSYLYHAKHAHHQADQY